MDSILKNSFYSSSKDKKTSKSNLLKIFLLIGVVFFAHTLSAVEPEPEAVGTDPSETMSINTNSTDCPDKCMKSGKCDKQCRTRVIAEQQMIEKITAVYAKSIESSTPEQIAVVDQSRFCPKETIQFKLPTGAVIPLANAQAYKGATSDHAICTAANGFYPPATPAPQDQAPFNSDSSDACYTYYYTFIPKLIYSTPIVQGPVKFECVEDAKTKTMSWKMVAGCKVIINHSLMDPIPYYERSPRTQHSCFPPPVSPPPEPPPSCPYGTETYCTNVDAEGGCAGSWETRCATTDPNSPPAACDGGNGF